MVRVLSLARSRAVLSAVGLTIALVAAVGGATAARPATARAETLDARCVPADNGRTGPGHFLFNVSACENQAATLATLPLHRATSHGQTVWYVVMDSSDQRDAAARGVNFAPKLANAKGTKAVQVATLRNGVLDLPGTVSFGHQRVLVPGPAGFPPAQASPPAFADAAYSPLVELPDGTVLDAPQVANDTGQADKVVRLDRAGGTVVYRETEGRYEDKHVHYASFEASNPVSATIEDVTYAPNLNAAPAPGAEDLATSAREELVAFTNGPVGRDNPQRQGENSTVLDGLDPHNLLHETPVLPLHADVGDLAYTPVWDVHFAEWTASAIDAGDRSELRSVDEVQQRVDAGLITGFQGAPFGPSGFDVTCPLISIDVP
jgi:hypothetical protein